MARNAIPVTDAPGAYGGALQAITFEAADTTNDNIITTLTGRELLLVWNNGGVGTETVTINSVDDVLGRSEDITANATAANTLYCWGPIRQAGWRQSNGGLHLEANDVAIQFAVIRLLAGAL